MRPAAADGSLEGGSLRRVCPADNVREGLPEQGFLAGIQKPLQRFVRVFHFQLRRQDENAVRRRVQQSFQAQGLFAGFVIKPRVAHGNSRLVGKAGQQHAVVGGKKPVVIAEHIDLPDDLLLKNHVDANAGQHAHADIVQHAVDFGDVHLARVFGFAGLRFEPILQIVQQRVGDAFVHGDMPAVFFVLQGNKAGMAGQHFNRDSQDSKEQGIQIQLFGESAGDLKQVVALTHAVIRKHAPILTANE